MLRLKQKAPILDGIGAFCYYGVLIGGKSMLYLATFHLYYRGSNNKKVNIHSVSDSFQRIVSANSITEVKDKLRDAYPKYDISSLDITECL